MFDENTYMAIKLVIYFYLLVFAYLLIRYNQSIKKKQRITRHTLTLAKSNELSLGDTSWLLIKKTAIWLTNILEKSIVLNKLSVRKEKYLVMINNPKFKVLDILSYQIIFSSIYLVLFLFLDILFNERFNGFIIVIAMVGGFISIDLYFKIKYIRYQKQIKSQLLDAIILMNNAFKAGKSTIQAVENTYLELGGALGKEFKQVHQDIIKGLGIDEAFNRLAKRTELKELDYVASTISIMTKTGGNIITIFDRILVSYYNQNKLNEEIRSLIAMSNLTRYTLIIMPFILCLILMVVNPAYFSIMFTTSAGNLFMALLIFMYIIYIYLTNKIIKGVTND